MDQRQELVGPFGLEPLDHRILVVARGRMHGDERRLVDHQQVRIFIQDRQRRLPFGVFERAAPKRDPFFGAHSFARSSSAAVGGIRATFDDQPRARAARAAQLGLDEAIEPHARELTGHPQHAQHRVFGHAFWAHDRRLGFDPLLIHTLPRRISVPTPLSVKISSKSACKRRPSMMCTFSTPPFTASSAQRTFGIMPPLITPLSIISSASAVFTPSTSVINTSFAAESALAMLPAAVSAFTFKDCPCSSTAIGAITGMKPELIRFSTMSAS